MIERKAIRSAVLSAGASRVLLLEEPMAAAIGAGLPVHEASGSMVVDIGGGTTEIAIIALSGCVYAESIRIGGDMFDDAIITYMRRNHGCVIGETTAERVKQEVASAISDDAQTIEIEVRGRSIADGMPKTLMVNSADIHEALRYPLNGIINAIKCALEATPPELSSDIAERGIVLTGGGALLRDLDTFISKETGLPVSVAEDPLTCVSRGAGMALSFIDNKSLNTIFV